MIRNSGKFAVSIMLSLVLSAALARPQEARSDITIETVEVTAQREALRKAIVTFVSNITRRDGETVARWRDPICPSVSGATHEQGEFVRSRILEVAAAVDAPVSGKRKCRANLLVILTDQPEQLWATWKARNPKMFFVESQEDVRRAVEVARPVSVWQNAILNQADGMPIVWFGRLVDSHIRSSVSEDIYSVIVLVDTTATGGATFGQLADYVAMVSLARIDLDADFASSPTILRAFAKSSEGSPSRLTNWDYAFLKSLYLPNKPLLQPRTDIMMSMREELAP